jgi:hypothetical protein
LDNSVNPNIWLPNANWAWIAPLHK